MDEFLLGTRRYQLHTNAIHRSHLRYLAQPVWVRQYYELDQIIDPLSIDVRVLD